MLPSIEKDVTRFFEHHYDQLLAFYPGLSVDRILRDFYDYHYLDPKSEAFDSQVLYQSLTQLKSELLAGRPLEYIFGQAYFYDSFFHCNESTLIPRSETEVLVELALEDINTQRRQKLLEIGTGTGCIFLSILRHLKHSLSVTATDIAPEILALCRLNLQRHAYSHANHQVELVESDLFANLGGRKFDIIVSNPPYIPLSESDKVHPQVAKYEPASALFVPDNSPLQWFEKLFRGIHQSLSPGGFYCIELSEDWVGPLKKHFEPLELDMTCDIVCDLTGKNRFLKGYRRG